jgi:uncharacterized membrane protein YidH (DUF202 family)
LADVRWEEHPEGLLFYLRGDIRALVAFRTTTQHKVTLWSGERMVPPDVGDLNRASFRKRLSKTAAEAFGLDEAVEGAVEHDLGGVAVALEKELEDENGGENGAALTLLGCLALVLGSVQFLRNRRRISRGEFVPQAAIYLVVVAGGLILGGCFALYVLFTLLAG